MDEDAEGDPLQTPINLGAAGQEYEEDVLRHIYKTQSPLGRLVYPAAVLKAPSVRELILTDAPDVDFLKVVAELERNPPPTGNVVGVDAVHFDSKPFLKGVAMMRDQKAETGLMQKLLRELRDSIVLVEIKISSAVAVNAVAGTVLLKLAMLSAGDGDGPVVRRKFQLVSPDRILPVLASAPHGLPGGGLFHDHAQVQPSERVVKLQKILAEAPSAGACRAFELLEDVLEAVEKDATLESGATTLPSRKMLNNVLSTAQKHLQEHKWRLYAAREAVRASKKRRIAAISDFEAAEDED